MKTAFITGANRGIGLEFARQYAQDGWHVIASCRSPDKAKDLQLLTAEYPELQIEKLDVANQPSIDAIALRLKDVAIDVLINNAGTTAQGKGLIGWDETTGDYTGTLNPEAWRDVLNINTVGPIMVTLALFPNIKQGQEHKIIMISSRCGSLEAQFFPEYISYNTSKAALNIGMRNMAKLLQPQGIIFASLHPGHVRTDMGGANAAISPKESVTGMRKVISALTLEETSCFRDYSGSTWPW